MSDRVADVANQGYLTLVYSGDQDFVCNWYGGRSWTENLDWKYQTQFKNQDFKVWNVDNKAAGELREYNNLKFLRVYQAGHMVPMDQPAVSLAML